MNTPPTTFSVSQAGFSGPVRTSKLRFRFLILAVGLVLPGVTLGAPVGTAFTYQGRLNDGGNPTTGIYDLRFTICDALTNGSAVSAPITNAATPVTNGIFAVALDFGGVFDGNARWLQIEVRTNGVNSFATLSPRQPLLPAPYAIMANSTSNLLGMLPAAQLSGTLPMGRLPSAVVTNNQVGLNLSGAFAGNGAGLTNLNAASLGNGTIPPAQLPSTVVTNAATGANAVALGYQVLANQPYAVVGGGARNAATGAGAVVAGGGYDGVTILTNNASGPGSVVSGGTQNLATGSRGTVGGGHNNSATNWYATVPGGAWNLAGGQGSFAAGRAAKIAYDGCFVWNDNNSGDFLATAANQFLIHAAGNVGINKNNPATALDVNGTVTASAFNTSGNVTAGALSASNFYATNDMSISVTNDLAIKAGMNIDLMTKDLDITASGKMTVDVGGNLVLRAAAISLSDNVNAYGLNMNDHDIDWRRNSSSGAGWYGAGKPFGTATPDGPVLYGNSGGGLGTVHGTTTNLALFWNYSGNVGIGTTSPDALLSVNGVANKPGGGSWSTFSDGRLKNVGPDFTRGLDALARLQPVHYHYKAENPLNLPSQSDYIGVVAQQVQDAIPEAVQANKDGYLIVNNDPIIWAAVNAIRELNQQVEARNQSSEHRNREVDARVQRLEAENEELRQELTALKCVLQGLASPHNAGR